MATGREHAARRIGGLTNIDWLVSLSMPRPLLAAESQMPETFTLGTRLRAVWLDAAGITVSVICAIHCAAGAFFLAMLALFGFGQALPDWLEWAFLSASLVIGTVALRSGHQAHGRRRPLVLFGLGMSVLLFARITGLPEAVEPLVVVVGAAGLVAAHVLNWRDGRVCAPCAPRDPAARRS
jgi:hypothetical protein